MMTLTQLISHQDTGWIANSRDAGTQANAAIAGARNATPAEVRDEYRSYIRWLGDGYEWGWVLK
jgi:hypothetical protein